jgi:hypothetical protein
VFVFALQELLGDYKTQSDAGRAKLNHHVISLNAQIDELTQENIKLERRLAEVEDGSQVRGLLYSLPPPPPANGHWHWLACWPRRSFRVGKCRRHAHPYDFIAP